MERGPLNQHELDRIRRREERATPGPWLPAGFRPADTNLYIAISRKNGLERGSIATDWAYTALTEHDANFLQHCREDVARLICTLDSLTMELDSWRGSTHFVIDSLKQSFLKM